MLNLLMTSGSPGERLLADLTESIPERGPPKNTEASKYLRDKIFELREPVKKGGTLRVLYFYHVGKLIICTDGVVKKRDKTPDGLIDDAVDIRKRFLAAMANGTVQVDDLPPSADEEDYGDNDAK